MTVMHAPTHPRTHSIIWNILPKSWHRENTHVLRKRNTRLSRRRPHPLTHQEKRKTNYGTTLLWYHTGSVVLLPAHTPTYNRRNDNNNTNSTLTLTTIIVDIICESDVEPNCFTHIFLLHAFVSHSCQQEKQLVWYTRGIERPEGAYHTYQAPSPS